MEQRDVEFDAIEYRKTPPDRATLERFTEMIPEEPGELVRKDARGFSDLGLAAGDYNTATEVVDLLLEHPRLMKLPFVVHGDRAIVARPPERVLELLD